MNLVSCEGCGSVFNTDKIEFPNVWNDEDGMYDMDHCFYNGEEYIATVPCPICGKAIPQKEQY